MNLKRKNNMYSNTIYKKDTKGKLRYLHVYTNGAELIQDSGIIDSENVVQHKSMCTGKNIGKTNETTPEQQAELEAQSKIETKLPTGYFRTIKEAMDTVVILPMLAKDFNKEKSKITYPCYVQPKLDGMRALYEKTKLISRKGKDIDTMGHIVDDIMMSTHQILDGELYAHGRNFQENMRLIKKDRGEETQEVKFHVYDLVSPAPFIERYNRLKEIIEDYWTVELVPTYKIHSEQGLKEAHAKFLSESYEGTIVRHSDAGYGINKRDSQLLKYKDFIDETYTVYAVLPSDKNPKQAVVHCINGEGKTFGCGMKFSHAEREQILIDKSEYVGKTAEIRFFEYSEDGIPRFPVCHGFRLDK